MFQNLSTQFIPALYTQTFVFVSSILDFYSAGDKKSSQKPVMFYLMLSMVLSLIVLTVIAEIRYAMNPEYASRNIVYVNSCLPFWRNQFT